MRRKTAGSSGLKRSKDQQVTRDIYVAIENGDTKKAIALLERDTDRTERMTPLGPWLHVAADAGNLDLVRHLVEGGADVNRRGGIFDGAALSHAASEGHLAVVEYLLSVGAHMDVGAPERNPLFGAIYGGHAAIVEILIRHGIDTTVKYTGERMKDMDALAFALERGQAVIARILRRSARR